MEEKVGVPLFDRHGRRIRLKELADEPLIYYTPECGLREIMDGFCLEAEFAPNIAFECTTPEVLCDLVKAGFGSAFIPTYLWEIINTDSLIKLHIENSSCQRTIWLSWVKDHYLSMAAHDFSQFVIEYFSRAIDIDNSI